MVADIRWVLIDVRRDVTVFATCFGLCGLATCLGASTVMLGSGVAEAVAVRDIAVPLGPHNNAVDRIATAEGATKLDDNLMTCPPKSGTGMPSQLKWTVPYISEWAIEGRKDTCRGPAIDMAAKRTRNRCVNSSLDRDHQTPRLNYRAASLGGLFLRLRWRGLSRRRCATDWQAKPRRAPSSPVNYSPTILTPTWGSGDHLLCSFRRMVAVFYAARCSVHSSCFSAPTLDHKYP